MLPEPLEPLPAPVPAPGLVQLSSLSLHPSLVRLWQGWLGIDGSEVLAEREGANPGSLKRASGKLGMGPGPRSPCHSLTASLSSAQGCWAFLWQDNHSPGQRCPPTMHWGAAPVPGLLQSASWWELPGITPATRGPSSDSSDGELQIPPCLAIPYSLSYPPDASSSFSPGIWKQLGLQNPPCSLAGFQMQNPLWSPFVFRKKTPELLSCTTLHSTACCLVAWPPIPEIVVFGFVV